MLKRKKMKNIKYILLIALLPLFFACEESKIYDGDARVKFGGTSEHVNVSRMAMCTNWKYS